jgi:hypothetical protein
MKLTKKQQLKLKQKWQQDDQGLSYMQFRRGAVPMIAGDGCIVVRWCNMWLGIEPDGHAHS